MIFCKQTRAPFFPLFIWLPLSLLIFLSCSKSYRKAPEYKEKIISSQKVFFYPPVVQVKKKGIFTSKIDSTLLENIQNQIKTVNKKNFKKNFRINVSPVDNITDYNKYAEIIRRMFINIKAKKSIYKKLKREEVLSVLNKNDNIIMISYLEGYNRTIPRQFLSDMKSFLLMILTLTASIRSEFNTSSNFYLAIIDLKRDEVLYFDYVKDDLDPVSSENIFWQGNVVWWNI